MRLDEALSAVDAIHAQLRRQDRASCYRSVTVALSGGGGLLAAAGQEWYLTSSLVPRALLTELVAGSVVGMELAAYVLYWTIVAAGCCLVIGGEMAWRYFAKASPMERARTRETLGEFIPCVIAGAGLAGVLMMHAPEHGELLPGLWSVIFGVGVLASRRRLPVGGLWIGIYYVLAGLACLRWMGAGVIPAAWMMVVTFGIGQFVAAAILYRGEVQRA